MILGIVFVMGLGIVIVGCGQQTPSITTTNSQPSGLAIKGTVYTTTLGGTLGAPIQGAVVALSGASSTETSLTNDRGEYRFANIPDGCYILIVTAEGHKRSSLTSVTIKPSTNVPADNTITVSDIQLDSNPIIVSYSPTPNLVISRTPTFIVSFNEAMDQSTVVPTLIPSGIRTYAISGGSVSLLASWTDAKTLVVTPESALVANNTYTLNINPNSGAKDSAGYALEVTGDLALASTQTYRVASGGVPSAPSNVFLSVGGAIFTSEAAGVNFAGVLVGTVAIYWAPSTGEVSGYKVYAANSASGNYHLISAASSTTNYVDVTVANILTALYGTIDINPVSTGANYPMINLPLYIKVIAYNGDGESAAGTTNAKELVPPILETAGASPVKSNGYAGQLLANNNYYLAPISTTDTAYIFVEEPLDASSVTAGNFKIVTDGAHAASGINVLSATLLTNSSGELGVTGVTIARSIIKIVADAAITGGTLDVEVSSGGIKDLAGNTVTTAQYSVAIP
jgi:hypothetical protein